MGTHNFNMGKIKRIFDANFYIIIAVFVFIALTFIWLCNPNDILRWFFNEYKSNAEILTYIGVICGSIIILGNLHASNKRNILTEKGQLDTRFKDAAILLSGESTSAILSGIYALNQIAYEASKDNTQNGLVKMIHDILSAFVRESSDLKERTNKQPQIIIQTIVDVLVKDECRIYYKYKTDLRRCVFESINFRKIEIENIDFSYSIFNNVGFNDSIINNVNFYDTKLCNVYFNKTQLKKVIFNQSQCLNVYFNEASLSTVNFESSKALSKLYFNNAELLNVCFKNITLLDEIKFEKTKLIWANFTNSILKNVSFKDATIGQKNAKTSKVSFNGAKFCNVNFANVIYFQIPDFNNTILQDKSMKEIIQNPIV